jgi:pyridine nucleotide-disulfide oxidoreductase family protein
MKRLVLAGGGHSHLFVLRDLSRLRPKDLEVTLVNPEPWMLYSGMVPGWIAGNYSLDDCRVDLTALSGRAGARFVTATVVGLEAAGRSVRLANGDTLSYDLLSLNLGSETACAPLRDLGDRLIPVKPLAAFQTAWKGIANGDKQEGPRHLVVVGGGAAGVEISMAVEAALRARSGACKVTLVSGQEGLLPTHAEGVRRHAERALARHAIEVLRQNAAGRPEGVTLDDGRILAADHVIAATGASAPAWLPSSGLSLDGLGFVVVDPFHRSLSHPSVFAAGDVCSRPGSPLARSGVHAVRLGPLLAHNLIATVEDRPLRRFSPRRVSLYLLSTGEKRAIASWGGLSAYGAWVWRLKDFIDRRFVRGFTVSAPNAPD